MSIDCCNDETIGRDVNDRVELSSSAQFPTWKNLSSVQSQPKSQLVTSAASAPKGRTSTTSERGSSSSFHLLLNGRGRPRSQKT